MCRSALRSSTARSSASLRSVMSTATPSNLLARCPSPPVRAPRSSARRHRVPARGTRRRAPRRSRAPFSRRARDARDPPDAPSRGLPRTRSAARPACRRGAADACRRRIWSRATSQIHMESRAARAARFICFWLSSSAVAIRRRDRRSMRSAAISPAWNSRIANPSGNLAPVPVPRRSARETSRSVSAGSRRSSIPQRRSARQSTTGTLVNEDRRDRRRRRAVQQAHDEGAGLRRLIFVGRHVAADDAGAEKGIERPIDRRRGGGADELGRLGAAWPPDRRRR